MAIWEFKRCLPKQYASRPSLYFLLGYPGQTKQNAWVQSGITTESLTDLFFRLEKSSEEKLRPQCFVIPAMSFHTRAESFAFQLTLGNSTCYFLAMTCKQFGESEEKIVDRGKISLGMWLISRQNNGKSICSHGPNRRAIVLIWWVT